MRRTAIIYLMFFLSGVAGLVYQVSWTRQVGLLLGHTAQAAGLVLSAYFAGLAVGYIAGGKLASRGRPFLAYALAEFVAAGWAWVVVLLLTEPRATDFAAALEVSSPAGRFVLLWLACFLLLLPATAALGATLPFLVEALSTDRPSLAYGFNTAGAFVGVIVAAFWLLVEVGVAASGLVAAGVSAACGVAALILDRTERAARGDASSPEAGPDEPWRLLAAGLSGFGVLALEVLYTRLFALVFHNSTYTFGAVVAVVVLALSLGALLAGRLRRSARPRELLALAVGLGVVLIPVSVHLLAAVTGLEYFGFGTTFAAYMTGAFLLVAVVVLPPTVLFGLVLPALWNRPEGAAAGQVGRTAFVNTAAGAVGAALTSLVLLPALGLWASFAVVAVTFAGLALVVAPAGSRGPTAALVGGGLLLAAALLIPPGPEQWAAPTTETLIRRWESAYGWIDVVRDADGAMMVRQNLHYRFGSTGRDAPRAYRQAHLPLLLHPQPAEVLFLGMGTGMTPGAATLHPEVKRATVVELIPEAVEAARLLREANFSVADHPRVAIAVDDARHFLRQSDRQFDVIVSDLFVPWESETGYLYTVEHFQAARRRLRSGGLFCQWLPMYQLGPGEFELIADSFAAAFPDVSLWWGHLDPRRPIVALVGGEGSPRFDGAEVEDRLAWLARTGPADEDMRTARDLGGRYVGQWVPPQPGWLNTDEHPRVEFLMPFTERNRALLRGAELVLYFDAVLAALPDRSEGFKVARDPASVRHAWQRLILLPP